LSLRQPVDLVKRMDPRVKPAGDGGEAMPINFEATNYEAATKVIAGLDPAIHRFAKCNRAKGWTRGQARG
jgi:hypothetical protein